MRVKVHWMSCPDDFGLACGISMWTPIPHGIGKEPRPFELARHIHRVTCNRCRASYRKSKRKERRG